MLMYPFELLSSHSSVGLYSYIEIFICWVLIIRLHIGAGACKVTSSTIVPRSVPILFPFILSFPFKMIRRGMVDMP